MAGRRPKPTVLKLVQGNPGKRPINDKEPTPKRAKPPRPGHMSELAKKAWPKVSRILAGLSVLTLADGLALEGLCEAYAELQAARKAIREAGGEYYFCPMGPSGVDADGKPVAAPGMWRAHPAVAMRNDADRRLRAWLVEFGLTPAARSKVKVDGQPASEDPAERFFAS